MKDRDFIFWLKGYLENVPEGLSKEQVDKIRESLPDNVEQEQQPITITTLPNPVSPYTWNPPGEKDTVYRC